MTVAERTQLMTVPDVAERCNISAVTVRRLVRNGALPYIRVGGQLRFDRDQLEQWLVEQRQRRAAQ